MHDHTGMWPSARHATCSICERINPLQLSLIPSPSLPPPDWPDSYDPGHKDLMRGRQSKHRLRPGFPTQLYPFIGSQTIGQLHFLVAAQTDNGTKCHGCWRDTGKYARPKSASCRQRRLRKGIFARGPRAAWHFNIIPWEIRFPN